MKVFSFSARMAIIPLIITLLCLNACTTMHFKTIAPPPPSTKLRVAVLPITGDAGAVGFRWSMPHDIWSLAIINYTAKKSRLWSAF